MKRETRDILAVIALCLGDVLLQHLFPHHGPQQAIIGTLAAIGLAASAAAGIGSSLIASKAAGNAATTQANAATTAAQIQAGTASQALDFQKQVYNNTQLQQYPWLSAGTGAITNLSYLLGIPQGGAPLSQFASGGGATGQTAGLGGLLSGLQSGGANQPSALTNGGFSAEDPSAQFTHENLMPGDVEAPGLHGGLKPGMMQDGTDVTIDGGQTVADRRGFINGSPSGVSGQGGLTDLSRLINPGLGGFGSLSQDWTQKFAAPNDVTEQNDPGYQFRLSEGQKALERSAAARGGILSGGTAKALQQYGQNFASNEYQNVYNRALQQYQDAYNIFRQNQSTKFNQLAAISGVGQTTAGQLANFGQSTAGNIGNILLQSGNAQAAGINNAAAARASGYVGAGNAYAQGLSGIGNTLSLLSLLKGGSAVPNYPTSPDGIG